ncbi:MAG: hypothetical protein KGR26_08110, partial [Cyanobacteria bacterium REEB65]|nr:hypothetical protein [Cyanobacteria bacterium REEB65]
FKYRERSEETVKDRANKSSGDFDDLFRGTVFKPKEGENNVRILPITWDPTDGPGAKGYMWGDNWAIETYVHRDVGPDKQSYHCPAKMKGEDCPICDFRNETDDEELGKKAKAKANLWAYIIDRADEKAGPQIWRVPQTVEKEIQLRSTPKGGGLLQVDHPDEGYDITFRRKGTGLNTEYVGVDIDRNSSYISDNEKKQDAWLEYIQDHPLPEQANYFDADYIEKVFRAQGSRRREERDEEDKPTRSRRGRDEDQSSREEARGRRSSRDEPADEEDRRGRGRDEEPARESSRERGRGEEEDRRGGRSRDREEEEPEETPKREREESRRRSSEPEEEEKPKSSGRYRAGSKKDEEPEDEIPTKGSRHAQAKDADDEEEEQKPGKQATGRAREALRRLKPKD